MTQPLQANLKGLSMAPAEAIVDAARIAAVEYAVSKSILNDCMSSDTVVNDFCYSYRDWILSTHNNSIAGLDKFTTLGYSNGTSESFDKFYLQNHNRRFRCFRGEYMYHRLAWDMHRFSWAYIDDEPIAANDAVIISLPFADTGWKHAGHTQQFLDQCHALGVPVLLDCAFFGICAGIEFDFNHPAITDVCFSLSKTAPVNLLRIGLRFTRPGFKDSLQVYHDSQYVNKLGASVGLTVLNNIGPDDTYEIWRHRQLDFCSQMNLEPSNTVIFGIDCNHTYDKYNRGSTDTNRICFSKYFVSGELPVNE